MLCVCVNGVGGGGGWRLGDPLPVSVCKMSVAGHALNLGLCQSLLFWNVTSISLCHGVAYKFLLVIILQPLDLMTYKVLSM